MVHQYSHNSFFLVRHGEAENNALGLVSSVGARHAYHLTEKGKGQIGETAHFLLGQHIDFLVASPVLRTQESAEILASTLRVPLSVDARLAEPRFGMFEDQSVRQFLDFMREHGGRMETLPEMDIEGYEDIRARVASFLEDVSTVFSGKNIVLVSHGDPIQEMYGELMGVGSAVVEGDTGWYPAKGSCMIVSKEKTEEFIPKS